jgi:hypothetical protein
VQSHCAGDVNQNNTNHTQNKSIKGAGKTMEKRRVVVTGLGAVTPVGNDVTTAWQNIVAVFQELDR